MNTTELTNYPNWGLNMFHMNRKPCNLIADCLLPMSYCFVRYGTPEQCATFIMLKKTSGAYFVSDEYISFLTTAYFQFKPTENDSRKIEAEIKNAIANKELTRTSGGYLVSTNTADNIQRQLIQNCNRDVPGYKMVNGLLAELFEKANRNVYR
ncbi:hypothetical protein GL417_23290 [Salmonella enterica]|nr:hypothetical protein [Salmonella enterica]